VKDVVKMFFMIIITDIKLNGCYKHSLLMLILLTQFFASLCVLSMTYLLY